MFRRSFTKIAATLIVSSIFTAGAGSLAIAGDNFKIYKPGLIEESLAAGETVFVDYSATWCVTCKRQERQINALIQENPDYKKKMTFVRVDWDDFGGELVSTGRNIPRRSTLIVLKGDKELGRIVAGTAKNAIKQLMDKGV